MVQVGLTHHSRIGVINSSTQASANLSIHPLLLEYVFVQMRGKLPSNTLVGVESMRNKLVTIAVKRVHTLLRH